MRRQKAGRKRNFTSEQVMRRLVDFVKQNQRPPTVREFADWLKVGSTRTALRYLKDLQEKRWIRRWPGSRGIQVLGGTNSSTASEQEKVAYLVELCDDAYVTIGDVTQYLDTLRTRLNMVGACLWEIEKERERQ